MKAIREKIEIGIVFDKSGRYDFGFMPYPEKKAKIDKDLWNFFVDTRQKYEMLYEEIKNRLKLK